MSSEDQAELLYRIADKVFSRWNSVGFGGLSEAEQIFACVWAFDGDVHNGGFDQFFFNSPGDYSVETIAALERIGAHRTADILRRAASVFPESMPPKDRASRQAQLDQLTPAAAQFLDDLYPVLRDNRQVENPNSLLHAYARDYASEFREP